MFDWRWQSVTSLPGLLDLGYSALVAKKKSGS
jgi:hypothetical protein